MNREALHDFCGVVYAVDMIGGRWKLLILYKLENKTLRFKDLKNIIPNISERMLTLQLRELEKDNLVRRTAYASVPPRVEYTLTGQANKLAVIWKELEAWGLDHRQSQGTSTLQAEHP